MNDMQRYEVGWVPAEILSFAIDDMLNTYGFCYVNGEIIFKAEFSVAH